MPVTATPADGVSCNNTGLSTRPVTPAPVACVGQNVIYSPTPTEPVRGTPVLSRMHAYRVAGGQRATISHVMRDSAGAPVDLTNCNCQDNSSLSLSVSGSADCPCEYKMVMRISEYFTGCYTEFPVTITDAANGVVSVTLEPEATQRPGVYFGQFALVECPLDAATNDTVVMFSNHVYVYIGQNLWSEAGAQATGPISIPEVRLFLRDTSPAESFLLDNVMFSDEEIMAAMLLPVQYWNEIPPPIGTYTTNSFPFRYHWLIGTTAQLFFIVAEQMRRNNLQYASTGVTVNDQGKEANYEQAGQRRWLEYQNFVRRKKVEINLGNCVGSARSPYYYQR